MWDLHGRIAGMRCGWRKNVEIALGACRSVESHNAGRTGGIVAVEWAMSEVVVGIVGWRRLSLRGGAAREF